MPPEKPQQATDEQPSAFVSVFTTLDDTLRSLTAAKEAVGTAYEHAGPEQKTKLSDAERDLWYASRAVNDARDGAQQAEATPREQLAKDGRTQFEAAKAKDARSIEAQKPKPAAQKKPPEKLKLATDKRTGVNAAEGRAKLALKAADKPVKKPAAIASKQVAGSEPKPRPKPSLDIAGGSDAAAHVAAKTADHQAASAAEGRARVVGALLRSESGLSASHGQASKVSQGPSVKGGQGMGQ